MKNKADIRFLVSFVISLLLHLVLVFLVIFLQKNQKYEQPKKVKLENLLVLKRGYSEDPSKNTQGARKPMLASKQSMGMGQNRLIMPQEPSVMQKPKNLDSFKQNQEKNKQTDTNKKSLETYKQSQIDPKSLSFVPPAQLAMPSSGGRQSAQNDKGNDPQTIQEIDELYGEEFGDLGTAEKEFIRDNLRNIGRITQKYLQYPRVAAYFGQSGINAVEFYLHPNGDISDLKIIKSSGLSSFDGNTLNTIEIAYKDYPRPKVKTLIRINVTYSYYGN